MPSLTYFLVALIGVTILAAIFLFNRYHSHERSYRRRTTRENAASAKLVAYKRRPNHA